MNGELAEILNAAGTDGVGTSKILREACVDVTNKESRQTESCTVCGEVHELRGVDG